MTCINDNSDVQTEAHDSISCASNFQNFDVMFAYNSKDEEDIHTIAEQLKAFGLKPWVDYAELRGGTKPIDQIEMAIDRIRTCAYFLGTHKEGPWQREVESDQILLQMVDSGRSYTVIPVLLPGAKRDDLPRRFLTRKPVQFFHRVNEIENMHKLCEAIRPTPMPHDGIFDILVEVPRPTMTCFVAQPKTSRSEITRAIELALGNINKQLHIEIKRPETMPLPAHLPKEIRSAVLVVVDCSPDAKTGERDPNVMYKLGLAHAIGKPTLIVTPAGNELDDIALFGSRVAYYNASDPDKLTDLLAEDLTAHIMKLCKHAIFNIVTHELPDISVVYSDVASVRMIFLDKFQSILHINFTVLSWFGDIHFSTTSLHKILDDYHEDLFRVPRHNEVEKTGEDRKKSYDRVNQAYKDLKGLHEKFLKESPSITGERLSYISKCFSTFKERMRGPAGDSIIISEQHYDSMISQIEYYQSLYEELAGQMAKVDRDSKHHKQIQVQTLLDIAYRLVRATTLIQRRGTYMLTSLLEVIGRKKETINE